MRAPLSWIREYVDLPAEVTLADLTHRLTMLGLKLEAVTDPAESITGPLVVAEVLAREPEPQKNGKTINWCRVDVGPELEAAHGSGEDGAGVGIVCGAHNFDAGDLVVVCLPGAVLPGNFEISARKTYGHVSTGMICSARELGLGEDHDGIIVLPDGCAEPGTPAFGVLGMDDPVLELEINPDRAYALSLRGIAREAALGLDAPFVDPAERDVPAADEHGHPVVVDDPEGCPVFVARTVSGFDPAAATPDWMVQRLTQAGMRTVSLGVDVSNYVMLELGQPNHCYDRTRLGGAIRVRRARAGEHLTTLDGVRRELTEQDLLIADDSGPIGIAGVMGGQATELSDSTSDIVVEAAHFDAPTIFHAERRHKLPSEASKRFERGVDPLLPQVAADRVVQLLVELGGATAEPGVTVVGEPPAPTRIEIPLDLPARVSGIEIDHETTLRHLTAVGCAVTQEGDRAIAEVPSWRPDLTDPYDLVEEVVRIVGYDRVPSVLPPAPPGRGLTREQRLRRRVGRHLAGAGLVETISYPFVGEADFDRLGLPEDDRRRSTIALANPLSREEPLLATTLLPGLLKAAARNVGRGNADIGLFETGSVVVPREGARAPLYGVDRPPTGDELAVLLDAVPDQPQHLAVLLAGERRPTGWWGPGEPATWADALDVAEGLGEELGVRVVATSAEQAPWHPGRCARLGVGGVTLGFAGELHPRVCRAWRLPPRTSAVEIDLDVLLAHAVEVPPGPRFSDYPVAKEDVALVVGSEVPAADVEAALRDGAGDLLESVRLFDVFTGDQVGKGRKSLAYALRFRASDRTLKEGEAAAARDAAVALAAERTGAVQRT